MDQEGLPGELGIARDFRMERIVLEVNLEHADICHTLIQQCVTEFDNLAIGTYRRSVPSPNTEVRLNCYTERKASGREFPLIVTIQKKA